MYGTAIMAGSLALASAWAGWTLNAMYTGERVQAIKTEMAELRTEYATKQAQAVEKAHAETIRLQSIKDNAEKLAAKRKSDLARDVAAGRDVLIRLSHAAEGALLAAKADHASCLVNAEAFADVFGQCRIRLREVAEAADGHQQDSQKLVEAWPQ